MAYIEREKVCEICNNKGVDCGKEKCPVYKVPTADVVPIEEVAKEFTCVFGQPHKVSDCPINEEIEKSKAYTVQEMQLRFARHFGTYTDKDEVKILEVFRLLSKFANEIMEDKS
jgi:hypothetical protein